LKQLVSDHIDDIDAAAVNAIPIGLDPDGVLIIAKPGRDNSPYLVRGDDTASIPTSLAPDELTVERALELLSAPKGGRELGQEPATGLSVYAKTGRFGPYVQLGEYDDDGQTKPKMASLFSTMSVEDIDLEQALELLSLPRVVGVDPADGVEITAQNGRYGPYIQKDLADGKKDSRSLTEEQQLLSIGLDEAVAIFAQPKLRRGQVARPPLRQLGEDPISGKPMVVKDGRFGPYVTDGETNASLRRSDDLETLTDERAAELLADRRDRGPAKKTARGRAPAKKAKKAAKKKTTAKKATAKKAGAKASGAKKVARAITPASVAEAASVDEPF
jgi:DNA topoisomerase I